MRGKHIDDNEIDILDKGSPPHARETHRFCFYHDVASGITPACAGNTNLDILECFCFQDHPRMRGKHAAMLTGCQWPPGSPPHARETPVRPQRCAVPPRITPACAGNTSWDLPHISLPQDHPRMRGKHSAPARPPASHGGSPPHARETPVSNAVHKKRVWITPACAGNTSCTGWIITSP